MESAFILLCTSLILFAIILAIIAQANHKENIKNQAQPVMHENATLISIQQQQFCYVLLFETENATRLRFVLSTLKDLTLVDGDIGILEWQGSKFLSFKRTISE